MKSLEAEVSLISSATTPLDSPTAYFTTVAKVLRPGFRWDNVAAMLLVPRPCILMWPYGLMPRERTFQERRKGLIVLFIGIVSAPVDPGYEQSNLQDQMIMLQDDLDRCILDNPLRTHPNAPGTVNPYGIDSNDSGALPISFDFWIDEQQHAVAAFQARYGIPLRMQR